MKKVLWSVVAAALILTLTGCAGTAGPVHSEGRPPQLTVEITLAPSAVPTKAIESEPVPFSAGNNLPTEDSATSEEPTPSPEPPAKPSASPAPDVALAPTPREIPAPAPAVEEPLPPKQTTITFSVTTQLFQMFKREKKVYLELTDKEYRLVRKYLMDWRNKLTTQGRDAAPVNELLIKLMA